ASDFNSAIPQFGSSAIYNRSVAITHPMSRLHEKSRALQHRAERVLPGGVNSPVRAFGAVGGAPPFIVRGEGAHIWDADGNDYIDYVVSWAPLILGHAAPEIVEAVMRAARSGTGV